MHFSAFDNRFSFTHRLLFCASLPLSVALLAPGCSATPEAGGGENAATAESSAYSSALWVDGNVLSFKAYAPTPGLVYVLGTDRNLWRETNTMATRTQVGANVLDYQPIDGNVVYVLTTDHVLSRYVGSAARQTIATGVFSFKVGAYAAEYVYYTDSAASLYYVNAGKPQLLANAVLDYALSPTTSLCDNVLYVLHTNLSLWRGGSTFEDHYQVDSNVTSFAPVNDVAVLVKQAGANGATYVWEDGVTSGTRRLIDMNATAFASLNHQFLFVSDTQHNLFRDNWSMHNRTPVDSNVRAFQGVDKDTVYVLRNDGNLYRESLIDPLCPYSDGPLYCPQGKGVSSGHTFVAAYGVETVSGTCPDVPAVGGAWSQSVGKNVPSDSVSPPMSCEAWGLAHNCCVYAWNPTGGTAQNNPPPADPSVLCNSNAKSIAALRQCGVMAAQNKTGHCGSPGGAQCPSCAW